jgi:hypothetical protein
VADTGSSARGPVVFATWFVSVTIAILAGVHVLLSWTTGQSPLRTLAGDGVALPEALVSGWTAYVLTGDAYSGLGAPNLADALASLVLTACCVAIVRGSARGPGRQPAARWPTWLLAAGAGALAAGAIATILELTGAWMRLAVVEDPGREQGAPPWVFWTLCGVSIGAGVLATWRVCPAPPRDGAATGTRRVLSSRQRRAAVVLGAAALLVTLGSAAVQRTRPEPVQGRYAGIPGVVVGRAQPYEYGSYHGVGTGAAALVAVLLLELADGWSARVRRE